MHRYLFKLYYSGSKYLGFQRQPNGQSIENRLEIGFAKSRLIASFQENKYKCVSRTDRGVSAICNMFSLYLENKPDLRLINSNLPDENSIIVYDYCISPEKFDIRVTKSKEYKYFLPTIHPEISVGLARILDFIGLHDFSNFIKGDGAGEDYPNSNIFHIELVTNGSYPFILFRGDKFGREQIRRIMGFLLDPKFLTVNPLQILESSSRPKIASADPANLWLVSIEYEQNLNWSSDIDHDGFSKKTRLRLLEVNAEAANQELYLFNTHFFRLNDAI